jgi:hypothetical protein
MSTPSPVVTVGMRPPSVAITNRVVAVQLALLSDVRLCWAAAAFPTRPQFCAGRYITMGTFAPQRIT